MNIDNLRLKQLKNKLDFENRSLKISKEIKAEKIKVSEELLKTKRRFRDNHKTHIRVLDIAVILIILMNLGALLITNSLAMRTTPDIVLEKFNTITNETETFIQKGKQAPILMEVNPVMAKQQDLVPHPEAIRLLNLFIRFLIIWSLLTFTYYMGRSKMHKELHLNVLTFYTIFYATILGTDFIGDLGFLIGKVIF